MQIMGNRKYLELLALSLLGILFFFQIALGTQVPDTAPFYAAVKSFSNNGDAFEAEFKNGMQVIIEESFGVPLAAITATISNGQPGDIQISSAAEPYQAAIAPDILALGGIISSSIARNCLFIKVVVPAEEIERAIEILEKLNHVPPPNISSEAVVPFLPVASILSGLDKSEVMEITMDSVTGTQKRPDPDNKTIVSRSSMVCGLTIVGSVRHETVLNHITKSFTEKRACTLLKASTAFDPESLNSRIDYSCFQTDLNFAVFTATFEIPPEGHPQRLHAAILREIIGGGLSSLLRVEVEGYSLNFQHRADIIDRGSRSFLVVTAVVNPDYLDKVEMLVLGTLAQLGTEKVPDVLLTRAKSLYLLKYYQGLESQSSKADGWAEESARGKAGNRSSFNEKLKKLDGISLKNAGALLLDPRRVFIREFLPAGLNRNFTPETFRETIEILLPTALSDAAKRIGRLTFNSPEISFSIPDSSSRSLPPELKKSSVLRGPNIHIYEIHNSPQVSLGIYYAGGVTDEGSANSGMTEMLMSSMLQTWSRDGLDPQMLSLEGKGCQLQTIVQPDYFGFRATVLSSNFEASFSELMQLISSFQADDSMVSRYRASIQFSEFLENSVYPAETIADTIPLESGLIYEGQAGSSGKANEPSTLGSWHRGMSSKHPEIVIYGDVTGTSFLRRMVPLLSNSRLSKFTPPSGRNRNPIKTVPTVIPAEKEGRCVIITTGLPGNSGLGESLRLISRAQDGSGMSIKWITLAKLGYGIIDYPLPRENSGNECNPAEILNVLAREKFTRRSFNEAKVRAITNFYLETENPFLMLNNIIIGVLSGEQGDFIRQHLVDLKQVRVVETESVQETLFGE